ncbi:DMT family transporter [Vibrio viridaestus]|uniref:EamA/RhaT family transporter n=1 Tax=Vibrio viridaestus TaxID=2487322 RepID=A0A3N9TL62_9VIBR|nr:EamA family transporter [Vibrio viridaestus]RQW64335.1 EamA/RhaT family transporter [Vibrio viridaestus]
MMISTPQTPPFKERAILFFLLTLPPLFWAGNFIIGRSVRGEIPPLTLSFYRWIIALVILLPFAYRSIRRDAPVYWENRWLILLTSVTGISAFNSLIYYGLQFTSANNGIILNSFIPLLISLICWVVFHQKLGIKSWIGMGISFTGVITIVSHGQLATIYNMSFNHGDLIIFVAMVCWAIYTLGLKHLPKNVNRLGLTSVQMAIGMLILIPFYWTEVSLGEVPVWNTHSILSLAYIGVVPSVLAYLLYTTAVERMGPSKAGLSIHLLPVFGVILSMLFLGESLHWFQATGMVLIFIGIAMS